MLNGADSVGIFLSLGAEISTDVFSSPMDYIESNNSVLSSCEELFKVLNVPSFRDSEFSLGHTGKSWQVRCDPKSNLQ